MRRDRRVDGVGEIDRRDLEADLCEHVTEQSAGRTDERLTGKILLVSGLFTHQHDGGAR